jgi:hypothetical protein
LSSFSYGVTNFDVSIKSLVGVTLEDDAGVEIDVARGNARVIGIAEDPMLGTGELGARGDVGLTPVTAPSTLA